MLRLIGKAHGSDQARMHETAVICDSQPCMQHCSWWLLLTSMITHATSSTCCLTRTNGSAVCCTLLVICLICS